MAGEIQTEYDKYIQESEDSFVGGEHLAGVIKERAGGWTEGNVNDVDRKFWIVFDDDLPEIAALPTSVLELLPIQLTRILRIQVTDDHRQYWAWTAAVVDEIGEDDEVIGENIDRHFRILVDLMLSQLITRPSRAEDYQQNQHLQEAVSPHIHRLTTRHHPIIGTYFSYPILEVTLKLLSSKYIKPSGEIRTDQFIQGMCHRYIPPGSDKCSSIRDLLYHYHNVVADSQTEEKLNAIKSEIEVYGKDPMYEMIADWRNSLLHGQELGGVEAGILLNFLCLLIWNQIDTQYYGNNWQELYRSATSGPAPFRYYPAE